MKNNTKAIDYGDAELVSSYGQHWYAMGRVWIDRPDNSCMMADCFHDKLLTYEDDGIARLIGLWLAKISVDNFLPPVRYYTTPMNIGWAVHIVRRAAEECKEREIRQSKLYEALDFLEKNIDAPVLVKTYRWALRGDRPDEWQKEELRRILTSAVVDIQRSAAALLVKRMNQLAIRFRENKLEIDNLRKQLSIVQLR